MNNNEYYKVGATMLNVSANIEPPYHRPQEYYRFLTEHLAHSFSEQFKREFSKAYSKTIEDTVENAHVDFGKVVVTIPEKAIRDLISVCKVEVKDIKYEMTFEIKPAE